MRNLLDYPITKEEIVQCLLHLSNELSKDELVGDMRPILLETAARLINESPQNVPAFGY
jgi:hypothetical protein